MRKYKFGEILLVKWRDSTHLDGWQSSEAAKNMGMITCNTVGMFHSQDDISIEICSTVADNEQVLNPLAIPQGCIINIIRLRGK